MDSENSNYLIDLINAITYNRKIHICIYDISGALEGNPVLTVLPDNMFHHSEFCNAVKTNLKGLHLCMKCKMFSLLKASKACNTYVGSCFMGVTEVVKPVYINNKLICVIYIGNFVLRKNLSKITTKIKRYAKKVGLNEELIMSRLSSIEIIGEEDLNEYIKIAGALHKSIIYAYNSTQYRAKSNSFIVEGVKSYINSYYALDIKIEEIAKLYFVNPNYLRNLFKKHTGTNFTDYINKIRISEAINLIKNTNESIINISSKVGYNNVTYFNKLFKRYTGKSPKQFRNGDETA